MNRSIAALLAVALSGCKVYDVRIKLNPKAEERRLSSGKSDTVDGRLVRADATNLYVRIDGEVQAIPRSEVLEVDQRLAKRDVTRGAVALGAGAAIAIGSAIAFECGTNDFPLFCAFRSEENLFVSLAFLGGGALTALGVQKLVGGYAAQSDTDAILRGASRWHVAPTVVRGESSLAPGIGATVRF
jgi:hypothetical protein